MPQRVDAQIDLRRQLPEPPRVQRVLARALVDFRHDSPDAGVDDPVDGRSRQRGAGVGDA